MILISNDNLERLKIDRKICKNICKKRRKKMKKFLVVLLLVLSLFLVSGCKKRLSDSYIEIDSDINDDYELFVIPNSVDIFDLTDVDLEFYWINTNDVDRYVVKLYESNIVITVVDVGITVIIYNQNGFYYILVEQE